jgi:hypothetical protein
LPQFFFWRLRVCGDIASQSEASNSLSQARRNVMSTAVMTPRLELDSFAENALKAAAKFWFVLAVAGQFVFAFSIASFYAMTALRGGIQAWNKVLVVQYTAGATMSNTAIVGHILFGTLISIAGAFQLVPQIRNRFPVFHRWNGRLFVLAAITQGITGLYMLLFSKRIPFGGLQRVPISLSGILLVVFAVLALRYAMIRDFKTHRRWALRLFLVAGASWFFRVGFSLTVLLFGPIGFDPTTFGGPLPVFWSYAEYLLPLAVLELYFRAQDHPGVVRRMATAALLFVLTLGMGAGIFGATAAQWAGRVKTAFDSRTSIADTLGATIASSGIDAAVSQYHELKSTAPGAYNFEEDELNNLGYQLIRSNKLQDAIGIFQLNVEAYPQSSNVYDSLGEAYMDAGNKPLAIANYQKSIELNPKNRSAVRVLQKLNAR